MALVIEGDKETIGGITAVREAFARAAGPALVCTSASLVHGPLNVQRMTFGGSWVATGEPFEMTCEAPAGSSPARAARDAAAGLVARKRGANGANAAGALLLT